MRNSIILPLTIVAACVIVMVTFVACDINDPDRYLRPPVIKSYSPGSPTLHAAVGDSLDFSVTAIDPDEQNLQYSFMLGDSLAATESEWVYVVHEPGDVEIRGCVSDGAGQSEIRWNLTRVIPVNLPPEFVRVDPPEPEVTIIVGSSIDFIVSAMDPKANHSAMFIR